VQRADGALNRGVGSPGKRARGTDAESKLNPDLDPGSVAGAAGREEDADARAPRVRDSRRQRARSWAGWATKRSWAAERVGLSRLGCAAEKRGGLRTGLEREKRKEGKGKKVFKFQNPLKQLNSNKDLNSNTQNNAPACMQQ
jgi:hypothetical protein